jgi:replicative DNA helicase
MPPEPEGGRGLPPYSRDAEQAVLGSMLRDNAVIGDVIPLIRVENFYTDAHQKIYKAITDLYEKGQPVDPVTLAETLNERKQIEDIGRHPYLFELLKAAPTAANAEYYARIVRDKAILRSLIHVSTEIGRDAWDQVSPADELLESAERKILEIAQLGMTGQTFTLEEIVNEAYERIDQRHQQASDSISGIPTGFADLDNLTAGLQNSELVIVAARPSVGKCLAADSEIVLADGSIATIEEIYRRREGRLLTLGDDWRFHWTEPSAFVDDGQKPVFRVTTRLGRTVVSTASHPYRTLEGWRPLADLRPGERIAVPRRIDVFGRETLRNCEVKLLAYLIGDGGLTDTCPEFTNSNPRLRQEFTAAVAEFGAVTVREENLDGPRTPSLCMAGDQQLRDSRRLEFGRRLRQAIRERAPTARWLAATVGVNPSLLCQWGKGACVPNPDMFERICTALDVKPESLLPDGVAVVNRLSRNPLTLWLQEVGLWKKDAHEKFIPPVVFRCKRKQVALFLNRLFATDGWASVSKEGSAQVGYGTMSEQLARQLQHLLLRFGIIASLRKKAVNYKGVRRASWQLEITGQDAVRTFSTEIGICGKEDALARVVATVGRRKLKPSRDVLPAGIWKRLATAKGGESWCSLARRAGMGAHTNLHVGKRGLSRHRLLKFAHALGDKPLEDLAASDVYWDEVVAIEPLGTQQVYDLTIPETHNFVANDVCVHNTAFSLNLIRNVVVEEHHAAFYASLEMSRVELAERLLCCQARVNGQNLRKGRLGSDDLEKLIEAGGVLRGAKLFIDDSPAQGMLRIAANARRLKLREDIRLVVIDYLQLIEPENRRDPRQEQVAQISRKLKFLAKELEIPVIALAQVNRASEDRQDHRPRLADLRESGSIEQDADTVMILHRPEMHEPGQHDGILEVIIAKQRNGPVGEITLAFLKQFSRFENYAVGDHFGP